ncbi:MAG: AraC family transcriptional regulator [Gammaproteobacteria bacterium]|nr:AraC family transcriptional regulator [Gammaproteobacteria bacterium]
MDPLTDLFTALRVESAGYARVEASAPWGLSFIAFQHAKFGLVLQGSCWLAVDGVAQPVQLVQGDCYLLTRGNAFTLRDQPRTRTRRFGDVLRQNTGEVVRCGGGGAPTVIIGGRFILEGPSSKSVTSLLPPLIHIRASERRTRALATTLQFLEIEARAPTLGSKLVINRLADILFVQAIRAYVESDEREDSGWLGALADHHIGAALRLLHEQTEQPWTMESLAAAVGMSRSAFALRFKQWVGEAPIEYLTRWRMYKAGRLLHESDMKLARVANAVGYDSEGAFNKAFKRVLGVTPGEYRRNSN